MKNRFQLGFLLGSLLPLAALCALGHSERVSLLSGAGFLLVPALLWPRRVSWCLERLQGFYERFYAAALPPAKGSKRQAGVGGPQVDRAVESALQNFGCPNLRARAIAAAVAEIPDEKERLYAAMRMVRA